MLLYMVDMRTQYYNRTLKIKINFYEEKIKHPLSRLIWHNPRIANVIKIQLLFDSIAFQVEIIKL